MAKIVTSILFVFFVVITENNFAQQSNTLLQQIDTIRIVGYTIPSHTSIYSISAVQKIASAQTDIADVLQLSTPVYINSYGFSNSSSVSIRGGNDDHTNVYWNGLKINSLSLGGTDISLIPLESGTEITVNTNTTSLGGDIDISTKPNWQNKYAIRVRSDVGSFDHFRNQLSLELGNKNIQLQTSAFHLTAKNNFPYSDYYKFNNPQEVANHNSVRQSGVVNNLFIKLKKQSFISIGSWYGMRNKDIPAIMGVNNESNKYQKDRAIRHNLNWDRYGSMVQYHFSIAHTYDALNYSDKLLPTDTFLFINSNYATNRIAQSFSTTLFLKYGISLISGYHYQLLMANVQEYTKKAYDHIGDVYSQVKWQKGTYSASLTVTQPFSSYKYLRPQIGVEAGYTLPNKKYSISISYSDKYRFPDLNDRYWYPGGNPAIKPEYGWSINLGNSFHLNEKSNRHELTGQINLYYSQIKNNIVWTPITSINWSPKNLKKTSLYGTELQLNYSYTHPKLSLNFNTLYNFNRTQIVSELYRQDLVGNFLRYKPQHTFRASVYAEQEFLGVGLNYQFVSTRYTDEENFSFFALKPYHLVDMYLSFKGFIKAHQLQIIFKINNICGTSYESIRAYAQPSRNYMISFIYHFKK